MSNIGKKVRILDVERNRNYSNYSKYIGKIGTIKTEFGSFFEVKFEDGHICRPNKPSEISPQCEFVIEEKERLPKVGDKVKIVDYQNYEGQIGEIVGIMRRNNRLIDVKMPDGNTWLLWAPHVTNEKKECEYFTETETMNNMQTQPKTFYITGTTPLIKAIAEELTSLGYNISDYMNANTGVLQSGNYTTEEKNKYLQLTHCRGRSNNQLSFYLPAQYAEALEYAKNALKYYDAQKYQPGDYIVTSNEANGWGTGLELNDKVAKVISIKDENGQTEPIAHLSWNGRTVRTGSITGIARVATPEEIAEYNKPAYKDVNLGSNHEVVRVYKDSVSCRGTNVLITYLQAILERMKQASGLSVGSYTTLVDESVRFLRIGCSDENNMFSIEDFKEAIRISKTL